VGQWATALIFEERRIARRRQNSDGDSGRIVARSGRQLAAAIGVAKSTVQRYLRDPRFPVSRGGPWNQNQVDAIKAWAAQYLQDDRSGKGARDPEFVDLDLARAEKQVNIQLKIEQRAKIIAERMVIQRKYVKRDDLERAAAKKFEAIKNGLKAMNKALRQRIADEKDPEKVQEILQRETDQLLSSVYRNFGADHEQN